MGSRPVTVFHRAPGSRLDCGAQAFRSFRRAHGEHRFVEYLYGSTAHLNTVGDAPDLNLVVDFKWGGMRRREGEDGGEGGAGGAGDTDHSEGYRGPSLKVSRSSYIDWTVNSNLEATMATAKLANRGAHRAQTNQSDQRKRPALDVQASFDDMMRRYPNTMARLAE